MGAADPLERLRPPPDPGGPEGGLAVRHGHDREAGRLGRPRQHHGGPADQWRRPRRRVRAHRPQVVLLRPAVRRVPHPRPGRGRGLLLPDASPPARRRAQPLPAAAAEGQARQSLQRLLRDRVRRDLGATGRRGGSRSPDDHRDGQPHPPGLRLRQRHWDAAWRRPGHQPCRPPLDLRQAAHRPAIDAERLGGSLGGVRGRDDLLAPARPGLRRSDRRRRRGTGLQAHRQRRAQVLDLQARTGARGRVPRMPWRQRLRRGIGDAAALQGGAARLHLGGLGQRAMPRRAQGDGQESRLGPGIRQRGRRGRRARAPARPVRREAQGGPPVRAGHTGIPGTLTGRAHGPGPAGIAAGPLRRPGGGGGIRRVPSGRRLGQRVRHPAGEHGLRPDHRPPPSGRVGSAGPPSLAAKELQMDYETLRYERDGHVTVLTYYRPEHRNAIIRQMNRELPHAWQRFRDADDEFVLVITGDGDAFCAGWDLEDASQLGEAGWPNWDQFKTSVFNSPGECGYTRRIDIFKPVIAAVNGWAVAAGLENALLADIRIASENAIFGALERRWNIVGGDGMTVRLNLTVGYARSMELIITGRQVGAEEARRIGLANEVVPEGKALERALELAHQVAELPQGAIRSDKETMVRNVGLTYEQRLRLEAENTLSMFARRDSHAEGARAFKEKRAPDWPHHGL